MFEYFKQSVALSTIFRQTSQDPEQVKFKKALLRLSIYSTIPDDYSLFSTQFWNTLTPEQQAEFDDVLHRLPTCASVLEFNYRRLAASAKPVLCCYAKHNHKEAKKAKSDDA